MEWGTGAKVWLWLVLVLNALSCLSVLAVFAIAPAAAAISLVLELIIIVGVVLLLFKKQKLGFFMLCGCSVLSLITNIIAGTNIATAVISAVLLPLITFFIIKSHWNELA
ncbi:MAG: hypothetical protein K2P39_03450 [Lachnospiraceae bacterium]|nr:hypothetical protein [Lachnospiraceae bacterium]